METFATNVHLLQWKIHSSSDGFHGRYFKLYLFLPLKLISFANKDPAKSEILKISERLANPVLSKIFKNQLFRLKQKDPKQFKDVCLYSEICKMFSSSNYALINRRVLHELFLDVCFEKCFDAARKMFAITPKEPKRLSLHEATSPTEFKTLDSLKLISVENKFPIRTRDSFNWC